jgi:hypothetical protein
MNKLLKIMGVREEPDCICYDFAVGGGRDIEQLEYCRNCDSEKARVCSYQKPRSEEYKLRQEQEKE